MPLAAFKDAALAAGIAPTCPDTGAVLTNQIDADRAFWRSLGVSKTSAQYGADQSGSLFGRDPSAGKWNLNSLDSVLALGLPPGLGGVTSPMLYFGQWRSLFAWHTEDMDLNSVNYLHFGAPKIWYAVAPQDAPRVEALARTSFGEESNKCSEFMRHKNILISPKQLTKAGIPYARAVQREREFMITFPRSYHSGFNCGWNCAESVNFATPRWVPFGRTATHCKCESYTLRIDMDVFATTVRDKQPTRLAASPRLGDLIMVKWEGMGEYLVRVGKPRRSLKPGSGGGSSSSANAMAGKILTVNLPTPDSGSSRFGGWSFDPIMDEWRWPSARDLHPVPGDVLCLKWKDYPDEYRVRVVDPATLPGARKMSKKKREMLKASGLIYVTTLSGGSGGKQKSKKTTKTRNSTDEEYYSFNPMTDNWHWPEHAEVGCALPQSGEDEKEEQDKDDGHGEDEETVERRRKRRRQTKKKQQPSAATASEFVFSFSFGDGP